MKGLRHLKVFSILFVFIGLNLASGQELIDNDRPNPYARVFVDTDNFGFSYLEELESGYMDLKVDSLRYAALNDLAYYTHTRDLKKSLELCRKGLQKVRKDKNRIWEGRFQITE